MTRGPSDALFPAVAVLDVLPIVAYLATPDGRITHVSRAWTEFTGYDAADIAERGYRHTLDPADVARVAANWQAACTAGEPYGDEFTLRLKDGTSRRVHSRAAPMRDPADGTVAAWFGTIIDIDERERATSALRESEAMYRALAGALPGVTWAASPAGELTYVGDRWLEIHDGSRENALGEQWLASVHPDDRERVLATWARSIAGGVDYTTEFRVRTLDGRYRWFLVQARPVRDDRDEIVRWVGVNIDIDDRHTAEQALEKYAALVENSSDFIAIADRDGKLAYLNRAGRALLEIGSAERAPEQPVLDFFLPADRAAAESDILSAVERVGRWLGDIRLRNFRTGDAVPVALNAFALGGSRDVEGGFAIVARDLRARKRVEDGLRLLARTGAAVVDSLDYQRTLRNIARAFVDGFAAYCLIDFIRDDRWERVVDHRERDFVPLLMSLSRPEANHPIARAISGGESSVTLIDDDWALGLSVNVDRLDAIRQLKVRSIICVPVMSAKGEIIGALTCALDDGTPREDYGRDDLVFVEEVGRRVGAAVANSLLYERERRIALELQRSSLPTSLPDVAHVALDASYRPGSDEAKIGGDWYDAFVLPGGKLVMTVGDVIGHGLTAAISMTKLRLAMQAASMIDDDPNAMLRVADAVLRLADADGFATAIAAVYDPSTRYLTFASAGHPGPALRAPDGAVRFLDRPTGPMLGLRSGDESAVTTCSVEPGSTLVFFTDGVIEVTRDAHEGMARLIDAVGSEAFARALAPADALVRAILGSARARDDIAVLVARFG